MSEEISMKEIKRARLIDTYAKVLSNADKLFVYFAARALSEDWAIMPIIVRFEELLDKIEERWLQLLQEEGEDDNKEA